MDAKRMIIPPKPKVDTENITKEQALKIAKNARQIMFENGKKELFDKMHTRAISGECWVEYAFSPIIDIEDIKKFLLELQNKGFETKILDKIKNKMARDGIIRWRGKKVDK